MPTVLTPNAAADVLRTTPRRVNRWARDGVMPSVTLPNGERRFLSTDLEKWLTERRQPTTTS